MNALTLVLRLIHILGGVFWVGAAWMMTLYIAPSVGATGDSGLQFMRHMMGKTNLQKMLIISSVSTVIAGTILYVRNPFAWFGSNAGIGFGIGAFFAFIGFVFGMLISRNNMAMMQLGAELLQTLGTVEHGADRREPLLHGRGGVGGQGAGG